MAQSIIAARPMSHVELARRVSPDLATFPYGWQVKALASESDRVMYNVTRQGGKSSVTAVIALHEALTNPGSLTLIAARGEAQSKELLRKVRAFYSTLHKRTIAESKTEVELPNGSRILALCGAEGAVRGFSAASVVIIDEAARVSVELLDAITPTLAVKEGRLIIISTPFGKRGFFHDLWEHGGSDWERYTALWHECPWISRKFIEHERARMTEAKFAQEYLCEFRETAELAFSYSDIERAFKKGVEGWDLSWSLDNHGESQGHVQTLEGGFERAFAKGVEGWDL